MYHIVITVYNVWEKVWELGTHGDGRLIVHKEGVSMSEQRAVAFWRPRAVLLNVSLNDYGKIDTCNNYQQRQLTISPLTYASLEVTYPLPANPKFWIKILNG
jgi:hypothetical protein